MGKLLILVVFAVLSKLSCGEDNTLDHVDLAEGVEYIEEDEPLTLPPPTMQPGCVLLDKPCGKELPRCCEGVCTQTARYEAVYAGLGIIEYPLYSCLRHGQKVPIRIIKIGQQEEPQASGTE